MKTIVAIFADFERTFWGGRSRLCDELAGTPVVHRTLRRAAQVSRAAACCLLVQPRDEQIARRAVGEIAQNERLEVLPADDGVRARRELIRSARKWNLDSWRGGPLCATWFDEFIEPRCAAQVLDVYAADAVLCLEAAQAVLDVDLADAMIAHAERYAGEAPLVFTQAPPGLAGIVLTREQTQELLAQNIPVGILLGYRPELARPDPITRPDCMRVASAVAQTQARFVADTQSAFERLGALLARGNEPRDAGELCRDIAERGDGRSVRLPVEVEIELTTSDPLPLTCLRPRGEHAPTRQPADVQAIARVARELAAQDDRLIFLGGHGDPLTHPHFAAVCQAIRRENVLGLAAATTLVELSDENLEALLQSRVDLLEVQIDAATPKGYARLHGRDAFEQVLANIERIQSLRQQRACPQPIVVPSITRCAATLPEIEEFYDRWIRVTGAALIRTYDTYCGALPADAVSGVAPPVRGPCRRLDRRMMLLADGRATLCAEDVVGAASIGSWVEQPIERLWRGAALESARTRHATKSWSELPAICGKCNEWFRP
ncbi:MAG: radical SAM protein [Phycisphaerae bacterium]